MSGPRAKGNDMTHLTMNMDGRAGFGGGRLLEIAATVATCLRWAYAMQGRYERLGPRGFQPEAISFQALVAGLAPDASEGRGGVR